MWWNWYEIISELLWHVDQWEVSIHLPHAHTRARAHAHAQVCTVSCTVQTSRTADGEGSNNAGDEKKGRALKKKSSMDRPTVRLTEIWEYRSSFFRDYGRSRFSPFVNFFDAEKNFTDRPTFVIMEAPLPELTFGIIEAKYSSLNYKITGTRGPCNHTLYLANDKITKVLWDMSTITTKVLHILLVALQAY